jgi:NADPH2:quinone reductase
MAQGCGAPIDEGLLKTISIPAFGGPEQLQLMDMAQPRPAEGEALVKLDYAGINFIDVYMRSGHYARSQTYQTPLPMTLGMEGAGTVADLRIGDRVAWCIVRGSYAEYAAVPAWRLVKVPPEVPLNIAAALMLQGLTAHYLSHSGFALGPGSSCLVHAAAGGVGQLLTQLAKPRGALVIATVGSRVKAEIASHRGADHVVLYRDTDLFSYYTSGRLKVAVDREFPLAQAADAHRYLEGRNTKGKLLLGI